MSVIEKRTATLVRNLARSRPDVHQALYRFDPPHEGHEYCVVSATDAMFSGIETYVFPADEQGNITDWVEIGGSQRGTLAHADALRDAGYELVLAPHICGGKKLSAESKCPACEPILS